MKWIGTKNLGMLLLGIWLVASGASALLSLSFAHLGLILAALAVAAGVLHLARPVNAGQACRRQASTARLG